LKGNPKKRTGLNVYLGSNQNTKEVEIQMSIVAIIPARGGSKRIPHKNIVEFCGKPMIAWTIQAAIDANIFDDIYVSTDSPEIATCSENHGAKVIMRSSCFDDQSTVSQATIQTLKQLQEQGKEYDTVIQLMANCPIRGYADIINSFDNFKEQGNKFQISCFTYGFMNPWWAVRLEEKYRPEALFPEAIKSRSQDLPKLFCPTGAIWIADVKSLIQAGTFYAPGYRMCPIPWESAADIDDYEDLKLAKALMKINESKNESKEMLKKTAELLESIPILQTKVKNDRSDVRDLKKERFTGSSLHCTRRPEGPQIDDEIRHKQKIRNRERAIIRTEKLLERLMHYMESMKGEEGYEILELRYIKGMTYEKIADKLQYSKSSIEKKHRKLLKKLKILIYGADAMELKQ
jgi:N-acylneuraminate cytidylyltransferase